MSATTSPPARPRRAPAPRRNRSGAAVGTILARGEPWVWLTAGGLVLAVGMIVALLVHVGWVGFRTFWPRELVRFEMRDGGAWMGEVSASETYRPQEQDFAVLPEELREAARARVAAQGGEDRRRLVRTGNFKLTGEHYRWLSDFAIAGETRPEWGLVVERLAWGRFYGTPVAFRVDGEVVASDPAEVWARFGREHGPARERWKRIQRLKRRDLGDLAAQEEEARLALRRVELEHGLDSPEWAAERVEFDRVVAETRSRAAALAEEIGALQRENARYEIVLRTADGVEQPLAPDVIVRAYPPNRLSVWGRLEVYGSRWWEFLSAEPREANSEGGVWPAIFGTVVMTLIMSVVVVPFGVLAALYLREYARQGLIVSAVRVAVNNLAGVPSIVFGVFGLGFFCYVIGARVDQLFYAAELPNPTFGTGGLLWASLTLALLTLPVVIVATEEALAAVPGSMREGSYACGATKWQTIRRIVLPRAMPGIMTGMILAIARGAGEVAPLMLVGAVKLAPDLPFDLRDWSGHLGPIPTGAAHLERSFMHLGFHIYDLGFQSQNIVAATPMVYTTTLLLIGIIVSLNLVAIAVRSRLRRKFHVAHL